MKTSHIVAATVGTVAIAAVGYALYFDSRRRNDPNFRQKERKRAQKHAQDDEDKKSITRSAQSIEEALASIDESEFPNSMEDREKYCMEQLATGEALFTQGPDGYDASAVCFYKALKVYPAPAELVMVYQKTIPPEVFTLVMGMLSMDVHKKQQKYYTVFPPADMNVKVQEMSEGTNAEGQKVIRRGLVATKDFAVGETIYSEKPIINSLEPSLEGSEFCHYCMKQIADDGSKTPCPTCSRVVFCSEHCEDRASHEFHPVLCTKDSDDASTPELALYNYTKETNNKYPEMVAKFLVRMVHEEAQDSGEEYNSFDHIERLRFLEVRPSVAEEREIELLRSLLGSKIPGIEEFINEERYLTLKGKLLYNAYGISTSQDSERRIEPSPEQYRSDHEAPVVGAGFYRVSSYMSHSCVPNTKVTFAEHDMNMSVVAASDIKAGEELHVGFIDQKNGSLSTEQRRQELFQHYRFKCVYSHPSVSFPTPSFVAFPEQSTFHATLSMASIHPLAPSGSSLPLSANGVKKPAAKGIPIDVPTTQRRMSAFSVKTANRALMTGYRDGGPQRRKSSITSVQGAGHMSPPYSNGKDDFELVGVLPGYESLVENEARRHKAKQALVEHKPAKRKRNSKELDSQELHPVGSSKSRRHSMIAGSSSGLGTVPLMAVTPQSNSTKSGVSSIFSPPSKTRVRKLSLSGISPTLPTRSLIAGANIPSRIAVNTVRIGNRTEFTMSGMSIVFGSDKITLNINGNSTRILHSQLHLVEFYTASPTKIIQIVTREKLPESSVLFRIYDPGHKTGRIRKITLYTNERESDILDNCSKLKANGVDIEALSTSAGEKLLNLNSIKSNLPTLPEQQDETGKTKSIAVHADDAQRLNDGQFLNDTIIEFGLKHIHSTLEAKNRALADQVFVFNSFFFQRLLSKPVKGPMNSYESVKNWTAKVDIFSMKYIIIPIHEKLHWHLAVIANPGLLLGDIGGSASSEESRSTSPEEKTAVSAHLEPESLSGTVVQVDTQTDIGGEVKKSKAFINTEERPYMFCLDSLGKSHPTVFKVLRAYLEQELKHKKNITKVLTAKNIPGKHTANIPLQQNNCDCGIFLLHFVEVILRNPVQVLDAIVNRTDDAALWAENELETKRERYKDHVDSLTEKYKVFQFSQESINNFKEKRKSIEDRDGSRTKAETGTGTGGESSGDKEMEVVLECSGTAESNGSANANSKVQLSPKHSGSGSDSGSSSTSDLIVELGVGGDRLP
ncbi:hypothetical protein BG004_000554 [Podila humilis]|nr:hypothetical protein BG004_000554 [Podila humilis]